MGMGEPLANFDNVVAALRIMLDDNAYGLSRRRVTLSTSGSCPRIDRLRDACPVALAVSACTRPTMRCATGSCRSTASIRSPSCWPRACATSNSAPRDFVTFEYVMLDGVNDSAEQARELAALVRDVPCKFNLIPFNPFPDTEFSTSSRTRILAFQRILQRRRVRRDHPQDARRGHRRRLRPARGPGAGPDAAARVRTDPAGRARDSH